MSTEASVYEDNLTDNELNKYCWTNLVCLTMPWAPLPQQLRLRATIFILPYWNKKGSIHNCYILSEKFNGKAYVDIVDVLNIIFCVYKTTYIENAWMPKINWRKYLSKLGSRRWKRYKIIKDMRVKYMHRMDNGGFNKGSGVENSLTAISSQQYSTVLMWRTLLGYIVCTAVARSLIEGGENIHIFVLCPAGFFW